MRGARQVIEFHHERYDGTGYFLGLRGSDIPLIARVFSIVDVFDALVSGRSYRPAQSFSQALETVRNQSGTAFDPQLLETFMTIAGEIYREAGAVDGDVLRKMFRQMAEDYFSD